MSEPTRVSDEEIEWLVDWIAASDTTSKKKAFAPIVKKLLTERQAMREDFLKLLNRYDEAVYDWLPSPDQEFAKWIRDRWELGDANERT